MKNRLILNWLEFSGELKRRRVYPVIGAYAVFSWLLLQIGEVTFEPLDLPEHFMPGLIFVVITGFPIVLTLAWFFDFTSKGVILDLNRSRHSRINGDRPSIAILPFVDMSPDRDQGYFCEGVAEEILSALTAIPQLRVAARSSSFQYSNSAGDARQIGRELGVRAILEGSVRKFENRLRITAQLIKVSDGYHLWSKSFDEEVKDVFVIQDEIASCIAEALLETIDVKPRPVIKTTFSKDVKAYDYYLRGRQFINRFHKMDIEHARQMFRQAIKLDPDFGLAWAGFADCHSLLVLYADPNESYRQEAYKASKRAIELEPNLAEAHASRGLALLISEEFEKAEGEFKKAIKLNSRLFLAYYYYGRAQFHRGQLEMAAELFAKAAEMEPADFQSRCLRVQILRGTGRIAEAVNQASEVLPIIKRHLEWNPDDARALHLGAGSLIVLGKVEQAKSWLRQALRIDPDDSVLLYNVACDIATLGEVDEALGFLERAVQNGKVSASWMRNDADLDSLRDHPRYQHLLEVLEEQEAHIRM